jgi:hypothetical protein
MGTLRAAAAGIARAALAYLCLFIALIFVAPQKGAPRAPIPPTQRMNLANDPMRLHLCRFRLQLATSL